jgi:oligosaccharide repeat unit polymerase
MALGFGTGARSQLALLGLPAIVFLYIAYQTKAAAVSRHSMRAYLYAGIILLFTLVLVQIQATYRNAGFSDVQLEEVELTKPKGNHMFSEGLLAFYMIPNVNDFFYNHYPGQGLVLAMPNTIYRFILGPIPRALWNSKPVDPVWAWYNRLASGERQEDYQGTTVALGVVGHWYARYGILGVIQGGLFMGWLMRSAERAIQQHQGKKFALLLSVAFSAWIFALYRDINFSGLYPIIFAALIMAVLIPVVRAFTGSSAVVVAEYA